MAREAHHPLGHLRQGLEWQAEADQRSAEAAVYARLAELDALSIANRFRATNPPADAIKKFTALLEKLIEAIRANPGHPGRPQSRWEREALQELQRFAEQTSVEQPRPVERAPPPPAKPTPPRPIKPPPPPLVKRSLPSPMKRRPQPSRESGAAPALHRRTEKVRQVAPPSGEQAAPARAKKLTRAQFDRLVAFAKKKFGRLEIIPGRPVTGPALEAEFGQPIVREDYRAIMNKVIPSKERKGGRPKNPAK